MDPARRPKQACPVESRGRSRQQTGAVLLEVVLALVLFVGAAAVLTSGLSSSLDGVERLRLNTHAANLGVSVLSEIQMGLKTSTLTGPQPFEAPFEAWTWEAVTSPLKEGADDASPFQKIEVIVRHTGSGLVYRLTQVIRLDESRTSATREAHGVDAF